MTVRPANLFQLTRKGPRAEERPLQVSYATSGIDGRPHLSVTDTQGTRSFVGDQIVASASALGTLVTVTLQAIPDLSTTTLTLVLPDVNCADGPVSFVSHAVRTTNRTSIGGPALVKGALQTYEVARMAGTGSAVVF